MRKTRLLLAAATVAVTLTGGLVAASRSDHADAAVGAITWQDEFNGSAGAAIDGSKWNFDTGGSGFGNNELEYYTNSTRNVSTDGQGHLAITARRENPSNFQCWYGTCQYTSGRILTSGKFTQKYGKFEASIKIPRGQGIWPAFWMLGDNIGSVGWPNSGEIDIMENVGSQPNTVYGTVHGPGYSGAGGVGGSRNIGTALGDAFHNFAVTWSPNLIVWTLDGSEYFRVTPSNVSGNWVFDHPFFIILNVAVGGNWPGSPNASTVFPQTMLVDYVRVSAWNDGGTPPPPPPGGVSLRSNFSGRCIDIPGANPVDGARLQMYDCNGTVAQKWTFNADGSVSAMGKCVDAQAAGTSNGTPIQLYTCNGTGAQKFTLTGAGDLVNPQSNRCVDIKDWNSNNGAQLQLWDCSGGSNQKWSKV
jgi:beta-glucanase (GH16 family)